MPKKRYRLLISLFAVSIILMTFQSRSGALRPLAFLEKPLYSVNLAVSALKDAVTDPFVKYTRREEEVQRLRRQLQSFKAREQRMREVELENRRLSSLLELRERQEGFVTAARVVARGSDRWANTFIIDKGGKDSVAKDMAVVTADGLLGKVLDAGYTHSTVLLLDDLRFSAAVRLQSTRTEAVLSGAGSGRCVLKYVPVDEAVEEGETVVTSGLDSLFPPGITVGFVSRVSTEGDALFHDIEVIPYVDTSRVEEAVVMRR
ncbi:MAG: hypothetical protein Kow0025_23260 [Thermodesulfovibrionales bacterium]